jgi:hypothetical protein
MIVISTFVRSSPSMLPFFPKQERADKLLRTSCIKRRSKVTEKHIMQTRLGIKNIKIMVNTATAGLDEKYALIK